MLLKSVLVAIRLVLLLVEATTWRIEEKGIRSELVPKTRDDIGNVAAPRACVMQRGNLINDDSNVGPAT